MPRTYTPDKPKRDRRGAPTKAEKGESLKVRLVAYVDPSVAKTIRESGMKPGEWIERRLIDKDREGDV